MKTESKVEKKNKNKKSARATKPAAAKKESAGKDAFGGRIGSRSNKINAVLIEGFIGSAAKIAAKAKEPVANVSAQLSWLHGKGLVARKKEDGEFIYKISKAIAGNGKAHKPAKEAAPAEEDTTGEATATE
jgi:hypothetical protein